MKKWPETGEPFGEDVETMRVIVMGIGAKDSFLIQCGGENMLIDSGTYSAAAKVYERLVALGVDHLDYAVNTHPHDDHIDGFNYLYEKGVKIDKFYTAFPLNYDEHQRRAISTARAHGTDDARDRDGHRREGQLPHSVRWRKHAHRQRHLFRGREGV